MITNHVTRLAIVAAGASALLLGAASASQAGTACTPVSGRYVEHAVSGPDCTSPVGLCIAGKYFGAVRGAFSGAATSIVATADTPSTQVSLFTSASSITGRVGWRSGTLLIKNAGAFSAVDGGPIVDVQTIVGGTGALAGASGSLRAEGTFSFVNGGRSRYAGQVCLPDD